jgi:Flp pilus assembly protein TadG
MNKRKASPRARRGIILPLFALLLVAICGFVAFAVDLGLIAMARTQCQNAADSAALAGARSINGTSTANLTAATANAQTAAEANSVISQAVQVSQVTIENGTYHYNPSTMTFAPAFPPVSPDNYNLTQATVTASIKNQFSRVFGLSLSNISTVAIAAHRPRDIAIVLDYSGSMNNESDLWNCESYLGSLEGTANNTDPVFPQFGPYNTTFSPLCALQCTSTSPLVGLCNVTTSVAGVPAMVDDYYQNARGASAVAAFSSAPSTITNTVNGGDQYLLKKSSTNPALTWKDITGSSSTGFNGYAASQGGTFYGYIQGPGYWGKTFFIWPPDPINDWRKLYFQLSVGGAGVNDDRLLFDSTGVLQNPSGNYVINYKAILAWIAKSPCPFPTLLRAGNVQFYGSIPTDVPTSAYTWSNANDQITNNDQRFWKEYIDYTLGVWQDPFGNIQTPGNPSCSIGTDFTAGSSTSGTGISITGPDATDPNGRLYINATDNPKRPRHRFWFGPATLIQFLSDTGRLPGTSHDVSMIPAKLGISGALTDIQNNHPDDLVSLLLFSRPSYSGEPAEVGDFSVPVYSLGNNYSAMINALWYPPGYTSADCTPWSSNGQLVPRAHGDYDSNTATSYGFMLAYNQFSSNSSLQSSAGGSGGFGRVGAQKIIVLETDGMANQASGVSTSNGGAYQSYYMIRPGDTVTASSTDPGTDAVNVATTICSLNTNTSGLPGYATTRTPVEISCIAFGAIFEPTASGSEASSAVSLLQQLSTIGGTVFPSSSSDPTNGYKWCIGTLAQRQSELQQAFINILDDSVAVVLVQ